jgi:hypothetical protein
MKLGPVTVVITLNTDSVTKTLDESIDHVSAKLLALESDLVKALTAFRNCVDELVAIKQANSLNELPKINKELEIKWSAMCDKHIAIKLAAATKETV